MFTNDLLVTILSSKMHLFSVSEHWTLSIFLILKALTLLGCILSFLQCFQMSPCAQHKHDVCVLMLNNTAVPVSLYQTQA